MYFWLHNKHLHSPSQAVQKGQVAPPQHNAEPPRVRPQLPKEPEVMTVTFNKVKGSMGLSIVAAKVGNSEVTV